MRIRCVYDEGAIEDTPLIGAKGTAFVIESEGKRVLFDTGLRHRYLEHNLDHLEIPPDSIDAVAISQTHPDNCRALSGFLEIRTTKVDVYCPAEVRAGSKKLLGGIKGISPEAAANANFVESDGWTELIPKVWLSPRMEYTNGYSERFLILEGNKLAIVSGRCIAGPDVILAETESRFSRKPRMFVGSVLLVKKMKEEAAKYANQFLDAGVEDIYLNHCTSPEAMTNLRLVLGLKGVKEFYVGQDLEV
jgi:7,8-dihydropterin-6-yl-methyl-4-(beta-D-ribofuranosyl)aminobenzene 5'-phosphate synthase